MEAQIFQQNNFLNFAKRLDLTIIAAFVLPSIIIIILNKYFDKDNYDELFLVVLSRMRDKKCDVELEYTIAMSQFVGKCALNNNTYYVDMYLLL